MREHGGPGDERYGDDFAKALNPGVSPVRWMIDLKQL
jgi:hypothetical protein